MTILSPLILLTVLSPVVLLFKGNELVNKSSAAWDEIEATVKSTCGGIQATCADRDTTLGNAVRFNTSIRKCSCDDECWKYGDCCIDAARNASLQGKELEEQWTCQEAPVSNMSKVYSIYMVGDCPRSWNDDEVRNKCRKANLINYSYFMDIPVIGANTSITYRNVYCAICHGDTKLLNVTLTFSCENLNKCEHFHRSECKNYISKAHYKKGRLTWHYSSNHSCKFIISASLPFFDDEARVLSSTKRRKCTMTSEVCEISDPTDKYFCSAFAYYVYQNSLDATAIKNPICTRCNTGAYEFSCNQTGPVDGRETQFELSFAFLLDFNEMQGEYVGTKKRCEKGQIYDPVNKKCSIFYCGENYIKIKEKCVAKPGSELQTSTLNSSCKKLLISNFVWLQDQGIYVNETYTNYGKTEIEIINSSFVLVCADEDEEYMNKFSIIQSRLSFIITSISIICLALHITVYSCLPKMRNLPGVNLLSLSSMLFVGQLLLVGVKGVAHFGFCQAMAIIMHYAFLASFFWMNVMSIDICRTFTTTYHSSKSDVKTNYKKYSNYAWIFPAVIVGAAVVIDNSSLIPELRPRYGNHICWITRRRGLLVFFAIPVSILLTENIIFFILTSRAIYRTIQASKLANRQNENVRFILYLKLALIMGLTWIFGFVASMTESTVMWYVFIIFNASQGIYIFIAFTLKPKILKLIRDQLPCNLMKKANCKTQKSGKTLQQATSLSNLNTTSTTLSSSNLQMNAL